MVVVVVMLVLNAGPKAHNTSYRVENYLMLLVYMLQTARIIRVHRPTATKVNDGAKFINLHFFEA